MSSDRSIGGRLDTAALGRLRFHTLERPEQETAIRRMAACGQREYDIAELTGLSVEVVQRVLAGAVA